MAEYGEVKPESKSWIADSDEETKGLIPDSLGLIVQDLYQRGASDQDRVTREQIWESGWHAIRGEFPDTTSKAVDVAKERGIYVNLTKRKVHEARVKLLSSTLQQGKVPFKLTPTRRPRFVAPDLLQTPEPYDEATIRAKNCEQRIRDILDDTNYEDSLSKSINEMTLYGTGITKSIVLKKVDYPLYQTVERDPLLEMIEEQMETEMVPHVEWVSIWDVFPSPGATSKSDLDWVIQRRYLSAQELRMMAIKSNGAIDQKLVEECIETGEGQTVADTGGISPRRFNQGVTETKNFTVLELWHKGLGKEDIEPYIEIPAKQEDESIHMPVVITVLGSKVLRAIPNPFDGRLPYDFCYWQEQEDSIWGSGIYEAIRDDQDMMNFVYGMIVEGKTMASLPQVALNPNAFDASSDDFYQMYAGKIWRLKAGESVNDAFKSIIIPDVTGGLVELLKIIERNTDLASGQVPIGMGSGAQYQTKTATGMQILNENQNKLTSGVVRSLNNMITANVQAVYHWLMADSKDLAIKGDFMCLAKSYDTFMAKEVTIQQVLQLIQVVGQVPEMRGRFNFEKLAVPLKAGLGLEIEGLIKSEEEAAQEAQQMQAQAQADAETASKMESDMYETKALVDEKKAVGADIRKGIIQERLAKIKEGDPDVVTSEIPKLLEESSLLLLEQMAIMQEQQDVELQRQQEQQQAAEQLQQPGQGEAGTPPESSGRPEVEAAL